MGPVEKIDVLLENVPTAVRSRTEKNCVSEDVFIALITIAICERNTTAPLASVGVEEQSSKALKTFQFVYSEKCVIFVYYLLLRI